ncbi:MAG: NAD-dependent epimerase/dehydratase family protein, partial [candidate division Zixibacteria bacterium]|nr:NAD-dependent epimerase/dehydratase family protein [candidate division Zixibacteria bacterium]
MDIIGKKILITGASGSLGRQLIYEFQRLGMKPVAHLRETSETAYIDSLNLEKRYADLRNKDEIANLVEGIDAVIHTAAWVNFRKDRLTQFTGINTFGAVDLFQAARKAGVQRFVHVSTVAAIGALSRKSRRRQDHLFATEDDEFNLGHLNIPYVLTKHAAEKELRSLAGEGGTELVIVNPSIIIAPSRTGDDRGKALKKFSRFLIPEFPNRVNLVDIRDVAPGIIAALKRGRAGQRYILAGDNITIRDLILSISV